MAGEAPDPPVQNGAPSFIPNAIQNLECHFWKKQLERYRTLPSVVKPSQEVFSQVLPGFPQDSQAPQAPRSVSVLPMPSGDLIRPELQEHLEQQLWKRSMKQQDGGPHKIQHSVELTQLHGELRKVPRAQSAQKTRPRHPARTRPGKTLGKATRPSVGRGRKDLRKSLPSSLLKVSGINSEGSDSMKPPTSSPDQSHPEKLLRTHLGRKSGQIRQGQIAVGVHQSRLAVTHAPDLPGKPSAHRETGNLTFSKPPKPCVNIFHDFSILSPYTQRMLEAHITRFRVRHRWGLPLKVLKPLGLFKLKKISIFTPPSTPSLATCPSKAQAKAKCLENPSQPHQAETVITEASGPTFGGPLLAPQPACEEIQQSPGKSSPGDGHGPSGAPPAGQGAGPCSQTPPYSFVGRTWHGETGGGAPENHSSEASPSPAMAADEPMRESGGWTSRDSCSSATVLELNLESQSPRAEEAREVGEAEEAPAWEDTLEPSVLASNQPIHVDVRRSGSSGSSQGPSPPTVLVSRGQEEPDAQPEEAGLRGLVGLKRAEGRAGSVLLQDCETGVLVQDCASSKLLQDCPSDVFLAADVSASHRSLSGFQSDSSTDTWTSQTIDHFAASAQSSKGRPELQRRQGLGKTQGEASVQPKGREDPWRFSPGGLDKWLAELKAFHANVMTCPLQDQESAETLRSKLRQLLLKKENAPPESPLRRRMRHFLQWIFPGKGKRPEDAPHQGEPAPAPAQSPGSSSGGSVEDSQSAETQALLRALRHILKEKLVPHQGLRASEFNRCNRERQGPAGPSVCFQRVLSYQEQRRVMNGTASIPRATLKGHSCPNKTQWIRGRDSRWAFMPRMLGSPGRPCHHEWMVVGASGRPHRPYCPRHCLLQNYVSPDHSVCASHSFLGRTPFLQERMHTVQTKTYFSQVSTSSVG
uniref:SPATA31 domain-containing protein n=2 Tax=Suricata suricatta TaxID=37032 RepID=A0A673VFF1_SURSU